MHAGLTIMEEYEWAVHLNLFFELPPLLRKQIWISGPIFWSYEAYRKATIMPERKWYMTNDSIERGSSLGEKPSVPIRRNDAWKQREAHLPQALHHYKLSRGM